MVIKDEPKGYSKIISIQTLRLLNDIAIINVYDNSFDERWSYSVVVYDSYKRVWNYLIDNAFSKCLSQLVRKVNFLMRHFDVILESHN